MKNNIYSYILVVLAFIGLTACSDDFLDISNPEQSDSSNYWSTEDDALMALTSCYDALQAGDFFSADGSGWNFSILARETCSDNGDKTWGNWMLGSSVAECTSGTNDEAYSRYWKVNYELIKRCNLLIENVGRVPMDETKIAAFKAEAIVLRSYGYCNLVTFFRDVPYLTKPLTLSEAKAAKNDKATIVNSVIEDLKTNIPLLPSKADAGVGRMCQESAYALMGRFALYAGKYADAVDAYKKVYGKYTLFKSGDGSDYAANYAKLFTIENETCDEIVFGIHFQGPSLGEGQSLGVNWGYPPEFFEASMNLCDEFYCTDGKPISESPLFNNVDKSNPARYENRDPRLKGTLLVPGMPWKKDQYDYWSNASSKCHIRKWYNPDDPKSGYDYGQDYYVIRYAEVLLSYAEALIESNTDLATAVACINEVRSRVGMPSVEKVEGSGLGQDRLRDIVRHERRVELAFEDLRLADMFRWGKLSEMQAHMRQDKATYGCTVLSRPEPRPRDCVWPIPQSEIDTNDMLIQHDEWK